MQKVTVRIKVDATSYAHTDFLEDDFIVAKENLDFQKLVKQVCDDSHIDEINTGKVTITNKFEW